MGVGAIVVLLPALVTVVSLACVALIGRDARRRPSPDKLAWIVAFVIFSLAAGAEVAGALVGWSPPLVRVYYLAGAMLVVGFLGLGELYLLAPARMAKIGPGIALFLVAVAAALVVGAPVDEARVAEDGWHALERGPALVAVTVMINTVGTVVVAGGAVYSAWQFWRRRVFRHRMIGCLLIALGTLIVASGGTLTRLGEPAYLYISMAIGVTVIFAGYLEARRREMPAMRPAMAASVERPAAMPSARLVGNGGNGHAGQHDADPAIAFLVEMLATMPAPEVAERCRFWSVEAGDDLRFDRDQARRVWALRLRLPVTAQSALDRLPAPTQIQLATLYHEILAPGVAEERSNRVNVVKPTTS